MTVKIIVDKVKNTFRAETIPSYALGGVWYITGQLDELSSKATTILFPVVLLVVTGVSLLLCRSATPLILSCGLIPAFLLVGVMGLYGVKMNMVLLALPPLTLILGMAHAIHFSIKKWQPEEDITSLFARVAPPCMLSAITTALGFLSLLFSSYAPVQELGLWGAIGTFFCLSVSFLLIPLFLKPIQLNKKTQLPEGMVQLLLQKKTIIFVFLLLSILATGVGISRLQKGSLILDFFTDKATIRQDYTKIETAGIGLTPIEVDFHKQPASPKTLTPLLQQLITTHPEITHFFLFRTGQTPQIISLAARILAPPPVAAQEPVERMTILIQTVSSEKTLHIADTLEEFFTNQLGATNTPYITGSIPLYTRGQKELFSSMLSSFTVAFLSISLLIVLLFRSLKMGFIAMVPNLLPVVFVLAIMGLVHIPLSVATVTVASIIFGIVIDDTIHMLYGYFKQPKTLSAGKRLGQVFEEVGAPIITTTLVTGTGFLAFLSSPFIPLAHFGLLISLSLWMALLCDLFILPLLLLQGEIYASTPT